jgi:heat shock protein HslJ
MAATRMACPPPLDQLETRYLAAFAAARSWRIENGALTFADERVRRAD